MTVRNTGRLIRKLQALPLDARAGIGRALTVSVVEMDAHAKTRIQGGGRSGRTYRRRGVTHQASAPGEFPKTDRGQLVASLFFRVGGDRLSAMFGTALLYGRYLEYGTSRMAARPWLRPTFRTLEPQARQRIRDAVQAALRAARG
ncbi:hypothetical protein [Methylorubrum sp. SB2]|uniref:hypothetical protein n=1 Tax=Methylorubrum subtropicum TaxID=3138812 RepID=UPI00313D5A7B